MDLNTKMVANQQENSSKDNKICDVISSAIADIIKYSSNTEFRSKCFVALQAQNTCDAKDKLNEKLKKCINSKKVQIQDVKTNQVGSSIKNLYGKRSRTETNKKTPKENNGDALLEELDGFDEW